MKEKDINKSAAHKKEIKYDDREPMTKLAFSKFFKENLAVLNKKLAEKPRPDDWHDVPQKITKEWIGDKLGISYEQFRKIINRDKPARNRDCIIAVCAMLCLDTHDTNIGLYYNDFEDELDDSKVRDEIIMNIIDSHRYKDDEQEIDEVYYNPDVIGEINYALQSAGMHELELIRHRKSGNNIKAKSSFKIIRKSLSYYTDNSFYHLNDAKLPLIEGLHAEPIDKYGRRFYGNYSLNSKYRFNCSLKATIEYEKKGKRFSVSASSEDMESVKETVDEICYSELRKLIDAELRKWDIIYNDTKNFGQRVSARIIDGQLLVFAEKYNFDLPLLNEYYVMEYCNGKRKMYVSHSSRFMKYYLSDEEYYKKYGNVSIRVINDYSATDEFFGYGSLSQIPLYDFADENPHTHFNMPLQFWRRQYFLMLEQAIYELVEKLEKGEEYIADINECSKGGYSIISYFNAEKEFQCVFKYEKEKIVIAGTNDPTPTVTLSDGQEVTLCVQDLIDGAKLGLKTLEEVGRIKLKHGRLKIKDLL